MSRNYPHLNDTRFPDLDTENAYKYQNNFDYGRYTDSVRIKMLNVSWCGDYENAVYFESKEERDTWFDKQEGLVKELPTMFRLYNDGSIKVDVPIDECMDYNYVMIDYGKLPQQETISDNSKLFYFINNVSQASPNATTLMLSVDYWTSFINDMDISYVNLLRGHAPMAMTDAASYLANPIENSEYLLSQDVNYGELQRSVHTDSIILNDQDVMLGFLTNADMSGNWDNRIPTQVYYIGSQALSAVDICVLEVRDFDGFRAAVTAQCPQFLETVKGMFLIPRKLLNITSTFTFCGYTMHHVDTNGDKTVGTFDISKEKFGYAENIADIAKLYTFPYAAIEVNDFKGTTTLIKVEDTVGQLELHTIMCDMYPFLNIESYMLGMGGTGRATLSFQNVYSNTLNIGGRYYNFNTKWSIPVFAVQLSVDANWALNGKIGADATLANANDNAYAQYAIMRNQAANGYDNMLNNKELNTNVNNRRSGEGQYYDTVNDRTISKMDLDADTDVAMMRAASYLSLETAAANAVMNYANAGVVASGMTGGNLAVGGFAAVTNGFSAAMALGNSEDLIVVNQNGIYAKKNSARGFQTAMNAYQKEYEQDAATYERDNMQYNGGNGKTVGDTNAYITLYNSTGGSVSGGSLQKGTAYIGGNFEGNADRSYNAQHNQALLNNPPMFGQMTGTPDIISKPMGLSYNIVTQSKNAIRQAAEQFLRYGYMLNMQWNIGSFNLMPKFTYWLCDVVYCNDNGVYEGAQEQIKRILNNGVTVWRTPEEIGLISIYENGGK
jgi:hypothetical protein